MAGMRGVMFRDPMGRYITPPRINLQRHGDQSITLMLIDDPRVPFRVSKGVIEGSLLDGRSIAEAINKQCPARKLRIPTEKELLLLNSLLRDQLEGRKFWIWTETQHEDSPGKYILRYYGKDLRECDYPGLNFCCFFNERAVRFVEDR
jgi:hypothetical protein